MEVQYIKSNEMVFYFYPNSKNMANTIVLVLLIHLCILKATESCHWTKGYEIVIVNNVFEKPLELTFHCASGNDELGNHTIPPLTHWNWSFCESILKNTVFFCRFWWGSKQQSFEVFNHKLGKQECGSGTCRWTSRSDGFYLSDGTSTSTPGVKMYDWQ